MRELVKKVMQVFLTVCQRCPEFNTFVQYEVAYRVATGMEMIEPWRLKRHRPEDMIEAVRCLRAYKQRSYQNGIS